RVKPDEFRFDFKHSPDLVIPIAVLCSALNVKSELMGVGNLRYKESDRLNSLKIELNEFGTEINVTDDIMRIIPSRFESFSNIHSHNDHRIAMAFASISLLNEVKIDDPFVVNKSYPEFWEQLSKMDFDVRFS